MIDEIIVAVKSAAEELLVASKARKGQVLVVGCSTSEVVGSKIGTAGSEEVAGAIFKALAETVSSHGVYLAVQCCEHLNRSLVVERVAMDRYNWQEVAVMPVAHAGGALAAAAYKGFNAAAVVETISADFGLDIGQTLIGMHLKRVAVPVRLKQTHIGDAILTAARVRPPLIGGERAHYPK